EVLVRISCAVIQVNAENAQCTCLLFGTHNDKVVGIKRYRLTGKFKLIGVVLNRHVLREYFAIHMLQTVSNFERLTGLYYRWTRQSGSSGYNGYFSRRLLNYTFDRTRYLEYARRLISLRIDVSPYNGTLFSGNSCSAMVDSYRHRLRKSRS